MVWALSHFHYLKTSKILEKVQRRATKFILQDYVSDYKYRLISLQLLPINMWLDMQDVMFVIKCLKDPPDNFNILNYISFTNTNTRSSMKNKMSYNFKRTTIGRHFYFNRIIRLWNSLPEFDLQKSVLKNITWNYFITNFDPQITCTFHLQCPCSNCHLLCN